jgi:predicted  nucleic acid-binding Zn-ribbon protein
MTDSTNKEPLTSSLKDDFDPKWEGPATRLDIKTLVFRLQETFDKSDKRDSNTSMRIENIDLTIEAIQQSIIKFDTKIDRIETNLLSEMKHLDAKLTTQSDTLDFKLTTQTDTHETRLTTKMVNLEEKLVGQMNALDAKLTTQMNNLEEKLVGQMNDLGKNMQVQFDALKEFFGLRFEHLSLEIANLKNRADNVEAKIAQLQRSGRLNRVLLLITAISPFVLALVNR